MIESIGGTIYTDFLVAKELQKNLIDKTLVLVSPCGDLGKSITQISPRLLRNIRRTTIFAFDVLWEASAMVNYYEWYETRDTTSLPGIINYYRYIGSDVRLYNSREQIRQLKELIDG